MSLLFDKFPTMNKPICFKEFYEDILEDYYHYSPLTILEIGVDRGGSLAMWKENFPNGTIVGIDIQEIKETVEGINFYQGSQEDIPFLQKVCKKYENFDIIIDDASHIGNLTKTSFWYLFRNHLKSNGWFVIEDWGTGYWNTWPDGQSFIAQDDVNHHFPSHQIGMVGFIKQLIDEQGIEDITVGKIKSQFKKMIITFGLVLIQKG